MTEYRDEAKGFVVRAIEIDGEPWFVGKDLCEVLGISKHHDALAKLEDDERGAANVESLGGVQRAVTVNESGLYSLIFSSRKPEAREFRRWVTHEVLPSIRRTGSFGLLRSESAPPMPLEHPVTQFLRTVDALRDRGVAPMRALYAVGNLFQSAVSSAMNTRLAIMAPAYIDPPQGALPLPAYERKQKGEPTPPKEKKPKGREDGRMTVGQWAENRGMDLDADKRNGFGKMLTAMAKLKGIDQIRQNAGSGPANFWPPELMDNLWAQMRGEVAP